MRRHLLGAAARERLAVSDPFWSNVILYVTGDGDLENKARPGVFLTGPGVDPGFLNDNPFGVGQCIDPATGGLVVSAATQLRGGVDTLAGDFTLELFIRLWEPVVGYGAYLFNNRQGSGQSAKPPTCDWTVESDGSTFGFGAYTFSGAGGYGQVHRTGVAEDNAWHHVAYVREGSEIRHYLDGVGAVLTPDFAGDLLSSLSIADMRIGNLTPETPWAYARVTTLARYTEDFEVPIEPYPGE